MAIFLAPSSRYTGLRDVYFSILKHCSILKQIDIPSQPGQSHLEGLYMGKPKRPGVFALGMWCWVAGS
jgi:hypothetical protein